MNIHGSITKAHILSLNPLSYFVNIRASYMTIIPFPQSGNSTPIQYYYLTDRVKLPQLSQ